MNGWVASSQLGHGRMQGHFRPVHEGRGPPGKAGKGGGDLDRVGHDAEQGVVVLHHGVAPGGQPRRPGGVPPRAALRAAQAVPFSARAAFLWTARPSHDVHLRMPCYVLVFGEHQTLSDPSDSTQLSLEMSTIRHDPSVSLARRTARCATLRCVLRAATRDCKNNKIGTNNILLVDHLHHSITCPIHCSAQYAALTRCIAHIFQSRIWLNYHNTWAMFGAISADIVIPPSQ